MLGGSDQTHGLVMGRFMPPHNGHRYLIEFARRFADRVTVLVCTLSHEPIPGALRYQWMRELFPDLNVVHVTEEIPEAGRDNPHAHEIWAAFVRRRIARPVQYVFASEAYGTALAAELEARFIPVDPARSNFPISASAIREAPAAHWRYIPGPVRPYFQKRVCLAGGGAAERRELAVQLAAEFSTLAVPDVRGIRDELLGDEAVGAAPVGPMPPAGERCARDGGTPEEVAGLIELLQSQRAAEAALARQAGPVLVCAADALVIALAGAPSEVGGAAPADLYLALPGGDSTEGVTNASANVSSAPPRRSAGAPSVPDMLRERGAHVETLESATLSAAAACLRYTFTIP